MPEKGIAIAGAGLIGGSIAWRLAQLGARVSLFDAGRFGGETSSAGAGMLSPGGEFETASAWLDLGIEGMRMYPGFVEELRSESGLPIDFEVCGCAQWVEVEQARRRVEFQRTKGIRVEQTADGLFYPDDGFVDPTDLLRALRNVCEARGVGVYENRALNRIEARDFQAVVIAAGAWSSRMQVTYRGRALRLPAVKPIKGHLVGFDLEPGSLKTMLRDGHEYVLQRSSGFTIAGSTEEDVGFDRSVSDATCEAIQRRASKLFPPLTDVTASRKWIGLRPYSEDGPHIGRVPKTNVWLAYGHFRNGILLAPLTARRVADELYSVCSER